MPTRSKTTPLAAWSLVLLVLLSACDGRSETAPEPGPTEPAGLRPREGAAHTVAVYAAVVRQLFTKDHTLGGGTAPFERIFIVDGVVAEAANARNVDNDVGAPFSSEVKEGLREALADLPPIEFVRDPADVVVGRKSCPRVRDRGMLISLGAIGGGGRRLEVPNELYLACLGAQWLIYVLQPSGRGWEVTGTTGPIELV